MSQTFLRHIDIFQSADAFEGGFEGAEIRCPTWRGGHVNQSFLDLGGQSKWSHHGAILQAF
jgi:hypothetical protein